MASRIFAAGLFILFAGDGGAAAHAAAAPHNLAQSAKASVVGIIAGPARGTGVKIASDFLQFSNGSSLRVIPNVSKGPVQDINGLLPHKAADIVILPPEPPVYAGNKKFRVSHKDQDHFLDEGYLPALQVNYLPAIIRPEEYLKLVALGESAGKIGIPYVMVAGGRPRQPERLEAVTLCALRFLNSFWKLKGAGFSAKWAGGNLRARV
jgi:hypothetical protein